MLFLCLVLQTAVAVIIPAIITNARYRSTGKYSGIFVWVFGIINFLMVAGMGVAFYPDSAKTAWWFVDVGVFVFPCIANLIVKNSCPEFNKFDVAKKMATSEKENLLDTVSSGIKKCCEEMKNQPNDLHDFLTEQTKNGTITDLQATLLFEKFGGEKVGGGK